MVSVTVNKSCAYGHVTDSPKDIKITVFMNLQILNMCQHFKYLKQTFTVSLRAERLHLRVHQRVVCEVEDSVLLTEIVSLDSQEELIEQKKTWFLGEFEGRLETVNSSPRRGMVNRCEGWYPDWGQ
jgi:hypothetical protein